MLRPELSTLLNPISEDAFFAEYHGNKHFHAAGTPDRLEALKESFGGFGVSSLLALRAGKIITSEQSCGNNEPPVSTDDVEEALRRYDRGHTLTFNLDPRHPKVAPWFRAFTATIAPRPNRSVITVFCTPPGRGTPPHFDRYDVFNVPLTGAKRWRFGSEAAVTAPLHEHQVDRPLNPELRTYWTAEHRQAAQLEEVTMTPGSVLYLPRGYVHETLAGDEPAIGLSFVVDVCSTFELINTAMRVLMFREPSMRASANPLWHGGGNNELEDALAQVTRMVKSLRPEDLRPPPESADISAQTRLRRSPLAMRSVETVAEQRTIVVRRFDQEDSAHVGAHDAAILDWIDARSSSFEVSDVDPELEARYGLARLLALFGVLVETGYLTIVPATTKCASLAAWRHPTPTTVSQLS
jgi:hypothetical protein